MPVQGDRLGQVYGRQFRIDALIGKGAMAEVYRALDLSTAAYVALKVLKQHLDDLDPAAHQRFLREAEVQALLRHRNVAALLATGTTPDNQPYLVAELLRGRSLRATLKAGRLDPRRAVSYAFQALQGLAAVHAAGVLHRDLKPANIMLEPTSTGMVDRVVLIDFGFATFEGSARLTAIGAIVGSLAYIAPERLRGEDIDLRSDLYSIGIILYEMLMGVPPFQGTDDFDLVEQQIEAEPPPLDPSLPPELDAVIRRALHKQQADRYGSADEMAAALEHAALQLR